MKRIAWVVATIVAVLGVATPATAVSVLAGGGITVDANLGACATVDFGSPRMVIAGELSVVGYETLAHGFALEAETAVDAGEVFFDVAPIFTRNRSSWSGCVNGAQDPVRYGSVTYTFNASSETGDVVIVWKCVVNNYVVTCSGV